tara:strand:+ start:44 stop:415 length:372 start_codon:yes stop_codon:yes gene_type:complete
MAKENPMAIPGGGSGAAKGPGAYSVRPKSLEKTTKRAVKKQDKAAKSYVAKDLDKMEANKIKYQRQKELDAAKAAAAKNKAFNKGAGAGGLAAIAATVAAEKARLALAKKKAAEKKANTKKAK